MTREEIDAIYGVKNQNQSGITRQEIDAIYGANNQGGISKAEIDAIYGVEQTTSVSSPKPVKVEESKTAEIKPVEEKTSNNMSNKEESLQTQKELDTLTQNALALKKVAQEMEKKQKEREKELKNPAPTFNVASNKSTMKAIAKNGITDDAKTKEDIEIQQKKNEIIRLENQIANETHGVFKQVDKRKLEKQKKELYEMERVKNQTVLSENPTQEETDQAINKWLTPGYELTKVEQEQAKQIVSDYYKAMDKKVQETMPFADILSRNYEGVDNPVSRIRVKMAYGSADNPESEKLNQMQTLANKTSPYGAYVNSMFDSLHYYDLGAAAINGQNALLGMDERVTDEDVANLIGFDVEASTTQHPVASGVGNLAGNLSGYMAGSEIMQSVPAVANLTGKAGQVVGRGAQAGLNKLGVASAEKIGQAIGTGAANVLSDTTVDVALDTIPHAVEDARNGLSGAEVGINALQNIGGNLALNTLGEGVVQTVPYIGMYLKNNGMSNKTYADVADNISTCNPLNPLENQVKRSNDILDEESKSIVQQIDDYANGKMKTDEYINMGETPQYLESIGNVNNPLMMKQSTVNKTAYPEGYMSGKHNLGYLPFEQTPYQLNDPALVAKSYSQPKSAVIMTDMIDSNGYPVVMPIHMDKNSDKGVINEIASMYGRRNADKLIENSELLINNKDRVNDILSGNGLQLPELKAESDPIFNYSISNSAQNVNNVAENTGFRSPKLAADASKVNTVPALEGNNIIGKPESKVSKVRSNTLENSDINTVDELKSQYLDESNFRYEEVGEKETLSNALDRVATDAQGWKDKLMQAEQFTATDVDTMMLMYRKLVQEARMTGNAELWEQASLLFKKIQEAGTTSGQAIQAFAKWSRNTPEGIVADTFREIKQAATKTVGDKKAQKLVDSLADDLQEEIYNLADEVVQNGKDSRAGQIAYAKIGQIIDENTPKTLGGVVKSYLMDSMLLNFRTLISRNAGGNLGYNAMEFVRQPITAGIDKLASLKTGVRTRTGWNINKVKSALEGAAKGISDEIDDVRKGIHTAKSGQNDLSDVIYANSHPFKGNNAVTKALNKIDDITKHGLSVGDRPFYEAAYKQRIEELTDLRSRNLLGADVAKLSDADFKEYAELAAKLDGLTATYQDYGAMAKAFDSLKESIGNLSKASVGTDIMSQLTMPFTRTPGNIITRSLEYSPLGLAKNAVNTGREIRTGNFNQQRFADETGRNLLGMGLFGAGVAAYDNGMLTGSYSDDADMKNAQKNSGMQEYALNTGNGNFDISWVPVLGSDLTAAAAFKEAYNENSEEPINAVWKGAAAGADALLNTSTLQGMNRMFGGNQSYSTEQNLLENAGSAMASGVGQAIPSLVRQVAQSADEYERNISNGDRSYAVNNLINSIPVLREELLQPKVDNEGNLVKSNQGRPLGSRIVENMISPGKYTELSDGVANNEAMRLFESTGNNKAFIPTAKRNDIKTDDFEPTDEQFRKYQQERGQLNSEMAGALIESNFYNGLSDEEKEKALGDIYSGMKAIAKENAVPGYMSDDKIAAAYKKSGADGVIEYMQRKHDFESVGLNEGKTTLQIYEEGGVDALKEYAAYKTTVESFGLTTSEKTEQVYNDGGIPYLKTYSDIKSGADADGNGKLKKDELIPYLDNSSMGVSEKRYWFGILSTAKNPY